VASNSVTEGVVRRALARREAESTDEVRRLLDAALDVMRRCGTSSRPRVADIVAAAGLSNDAFYRYFPSKDALVAAILEDGTARLASYLRHQMAKDDDPDAKIRRWVQGVLAQAADEEVAATTLAVMWNGNSLGDGSLTGSPSASAPLSVLLREPLAALGSTRPELDASLIAHATVGQLSEYLWHRVRPTPAEVDHIVAAALAVTAAGAG
jgi:AcrR family transcriptional regulator